MQLIPSPMVLGYSHNHACRLLLWLCLTQIISCLLFILVVDRRVLDEIAHYPVTNMYARLGLNLESLRAHAVPTGPAAFVGMAATGVVTGGDVLAYRGFVLFAFLCVAVICLGRFWAMEGELQTLPLAALAGILAFPHSAVASATMLTEMPAWTCCLAGLVAWQQADRSAASPAASLIWHAVAGCCFGLVLVTRQYYLALLPALAGMLVLELWRARRWTRAAWGIWVMMCLAALPFCVLVAIWGGMTGPMVANGIAYPGKAVHPELNLWRPVIAAFYVGVYLLPFVAREVWRQAPQSSALGFALIVGAGGALASMAPPFLQAGPLRTIWKQLVAVWGASAGQGFVFMLGCMAIAGWWGMASGLFRRWRVKPLPQLVMFSCGFVLLFVLEQVGVGGAVGFFERYVFQVSGFIGVLAWWAVRVWGVWEWSVVVSGFLLSHALMWRYAMQ